MDKLTAAKKGDLIAALSKQQPAGAVPIWEIEFQAWDSVSGRHVVLGCEFERLTPVEQERALHTNAEIFLAVSEKMHYAALTVPYTCWEVSTGVPSYYWLPEEARFRQIRILRRMAPDLVLVSITGGVLGIPGSKEYQAFSYKLFDAPEEITARASSGLESSLQLARRYRDCGVEAVVVAADLADNHGPFFSPDQMELFVLPYLRRWAAEVKAMGLFALMHSDGNLTPYLEQLANSGLDALQAIDPIAGMDMRKTKDLVGDRLCLCGNIDVGLLLRGTPEAVYEAARDLLLTCKAGGGLILGVSNAVQPEAPVQNYLAMIEAWRDHGQYCH